jgi:hypothetical protein
MASTLELASLTTGSTQKMEWIPLVLVTFKLLVFGTGMFFAIKWHYDKEKQKNKDKKK